MRARLLIASLVLHAGFCSGTELQPFNSDGCSQFPDGTADNNKLWLDCCLAHDAAYWAGGTALQREQADVQLERCVASKGQVHIAQLMLLGVRMGGFAFWPTSFRWGYGWPYLRGYQALTAQEKQKIRAGWPSDIAQPAYLELPISE